MDIFYFSKDDFNIIHIFYNIIKHIALFCEHFITIWSWINLMQVWFIESWIQKVLIVKLVVHQVLFLINAAASYSRITSASACLVSKIFFCLGELGYKFFWFHGGDF